VFRDILTEEQQAVLGLLGRTAEVRSFYLAGGTALALYLGHRRSRDFDFFRPADFPPEVMLSTLKHLGEVEVLQAASGTLTVLLHGIPVSLFRYDYPLLRPLRDSPWAIPMADPEDIAAMKLSALAGRGARKDFVDVYFYCRAGKSLDDLFAHFQEKYRGVRVDTYHLLRSLTFFEDAEAETMPDLVLPVTWGEIKAFFRAEATRLFHLG
jgi:hypothetical protein